MNYYLIPITESDIKLEGYELRKVSKLVDPKIQALEEERISIIYSGGYNAPLNRSALEKHAEKTEYYYLCKNIPRYLLAKGNDISCTEILTGRTLISNYEAVLGVRRISTEDARKYLASHIEYRESVTNYFELFDNNKSIYLSDNIISLEAYKTKTRKKK